MFFVVAKLCTLFHWLNFHERNYAGNLICRSCDVCKWLVGLEHYAHARPIIEDPIPVTRSLNCGVCKYLTSASCTLVSRCKVVVPKGAIASFVHLCLGFQEALSDH